MKAGNAQRERLLQRGIEMSIIADRRVKARNGTVKHAIAFEAHNELFSALLELAKAAVNEKVNNVTLCDGCLKDSKLLNATASER